MKIRKLLWIADVVEKLSKKHQVLTTEVKDVFLTAPYFRYVEKGHRIGESVYAALGRTSVGRLLIVFFIMRTDGTALIVSAREMTEKERKSYEKR